jgi:hypothetical protein
MKARAPTLHTPFEEHTPYDIMVGIWMGTAVSFSPKGEQVSSGLSRNIIYWHERPTPENGYKGELHFRQDQGAENAGAPAGLSGLIFSEYDLKVTGKYAESVTPDLILRGIETRPDVYHFDGTEETGFRWYNSHHFTSADEKHIMGPVVDRMGKIGLIHVQIFTRISYVVPKRDHRALKGKNPPARTVL